MKTIFNILITVSCTFIFSAAKAQAGYNDESITAETLIEMQDGNSRLFAISPIQVGNIVNGFTVQWQTINEKDIASFQLEAGPDKKSFNTVKTFEAGNGAHPANVYQVGLKNSIVQGDRIYFRVKVNFNNGKSIYTDELMVKTRS